MCFSPSTIRLWNVLPGAIILAPSVDAFKQGIQGINLMWMSGRYAANSHVFRPLRTNFLSCMLNWEMPYPPHHYQLCNMTRYEVYYKHVCACIRMSVWTVSLEYLSYRVWMATDDMPWDICAWVCQSNCRLNVIDMSCLSVPYIGAGAQSQMSYVSKCGSVCAIKYVDNRISVRHSGNS